jgi:hypothetical protein
VFEISGRERFLAVFGDGFERAMLGFPGVLGIMLEVDQPI